MLSEEVEGLFQKDAIISIPHDQAGSGYFSTYLIPKKDGILRPILSLKIFNFGIRKMKFKMETLTSTISVMSQAFWLASMDLKDAYFHILIHPSHHKYLRVGWKGQVYQFKAVPFGLSSALRVITKVLALVIAHHHLLRVQLYAYLDDR